MHSGCWCEKGGLIFSQSCFQPCTRAHHLGLVSLRPEGFWFSFSVQHLCSYLWERGWGMAC